MPTDMQRRVHGIWDIFVQCWDTDRGDLLRESLRHVHGSHERRRVRRHQLNRERVDVRAHVQRRLHGVGDIVMQCWDTDRGDLLREL